MLYGLLHICENLYNLPVSGNKPGSLFAGGWRWILCDIMGGYWVMMFSKVVTMRWYYSRWLPRDGPSGCRWRLSPAWLYRCLDAKSWIFHLVGPCITAMIVGMVRFLWKVVSIGRSGDCGGPMAFSTTSARDPIFYRLRSMKGQKWISSKLFLEVT